MRSSERRSNDYSNGKSKLADERVTYISLNYSKYTLKAGKTLKLKAYTEPENITTKITWFSSNQKVAKVNSKGVVTAIKAGTVTITAKTENGLKAKCKITVTSAPVQSNPPSTGGTT